MNIIFNFAFIFCLAVTLIINPQSSLDTILGASEQAVNLCISLISIYAVWLGILEIVEQSGVNKKLAKLLSPIINFLFGKQPDDVKEQIAINLSSNMLGMGNASIPSGIKAMKMLDKGDGKITPPMVMLMVVNSMSLQLIPTTIIGLKVAYGSKNPTDIIIPILISSIISSIIAITLVKLFYRNKKTRNKKHFKRS